MKTVRKYRSSVDAEGLQRGFTLIELVIVLAVLGALAAIAVPKLRGLQEEAELIGTATTVSSELSNAFAKALLNKNIKNDNGINWATNVCEKGYDGTSNRLESVSPTLLSTRYQITGLTAGGVGNAPENGLKAEVRIPYYDLDDDKVGQVGKGENDPKTCYLSIE